MHELRTDEEIKAVLETARTIAVLGAHVRPEKPAHYVPAYLHRQGYRVLPVNPVYAGRVLWGEVVRPALEALEEPVDIVNVFRRSEALPAHLPDLLAMHPRPRVVWFQLGIRNDAVAAALTAHGIRVVQDRCTLAEHQRLLGSR
ncbi:CoA-binding protein [Marinithermus hydrothermalis]|uniref:CoA-binding domain protein n=1 Tax=Marinithermus hydrothermalis (strain DSM 14884 / JCM 11576 / T1) TaxID=869210 RepID=F2NND1_MARHT|nr:CoA-binding protein [Marinithermus hydrothermalis]AEB10972.1 CoA-binding domain protein [Marinithermus hydrothermalis DSM 14884]